MNKKYWEEVAKIFGFELGEKFDVLNESGGRFFNSPYVFTREGFFNSTESHSFDIFVGIMNGKYTINKLPWKPKAKEKFWSVSPTGTVYSYSFSEKNSMDRLLYKSGNCFKTEEEAGRNAGRIIAMLQSDELFGNV